MIIIVIIGILTIQNNQKAIAISKLILVLNCHFDLTSSEKSETKNC